MKILVVFGTRPEVIKLAPVVGALGGRAGLVLCSTGQHADMVPEALDSFGLAADIDLGLMSADQPLNALAGRIIAGIDQVLVDALPDWVIVQGDTTTAFAGGLAAFHRRIRVAHVEAGLRTGQLADPFPEEANRRLLAQVASLHFAPTEMARTNLLREGVDDARIVVTGNTVVDAVERMRPSLNVSGNGRRVLVTCHRREALGEGLVAVCEAVARLARRYPDWRFVFPVHPNPSVRGPVFRLLAGVGNVDLIAPLSYRASLELLAGSSLVITDSGGLQEEAPAFGVPVVVIRNHTERGEGIAAGCATLAGLKPEAIEDAAVAWLDHPARADRLRSLPNPYGDGRAAGRIADALLASGAGAP